MWPMHWHTPVISACQVISVCRPFMACEGIIVAGTYFEVVG